MGYDLGNFHIAEDSQEGQLIRSIIARDHVTPEDAVRRVLRDASVSTRWPGELLIGLFRDDPEIMAEIAKESREARDREYSFDQNA